MEWYVKAIQKYAEFSGRSRRKEYWIFTLINTIIGIILTSLQSISELFVVLTVLYSLFVLIPGIAVTVRRFHDIGRSGFWILISFIPLVGSIILFVFTLLDSEQGENKYGPNPKFE
ncbi:DUF805 domain-containing protein [Paraliobacillus sp. X-1268]|uniref:DUF805 domain-containing protein n=1 Tax=Paraliobacillus sp. X-1268 TaxID=2213193 RepID=UPI000E3C099A|nr:DUF805 domain-containing protein [Paraliobacillus sp. X-1268]